ncbi:MAG: hypothetical protein VW665_06080 [Candidatus Puniceispirillum sp.]
MKQTTLSGILCAAFLLGACASNQQTTACPAITAPEEGVRVLVLSDETNQPIEVRLNGVKASCSKLKSDMVLMEINLGLKVKRNLNANDGNGSVGIPVLTAIVAENGKVIRNDRQIYVAGYKEGEAVKYPVAEFDQKVPAGARLVISLAPSQ